MIQEIIVLGLMIAFFLLGRIAGQIYAIRQPPVEQMATITKQKHKKRTKSTQQIEKPGIKIDETKVVISSNTDSLEKKYNQLGEIKNSDENVSSSIDKLKNIKRGE